MARLRDVLWLGIGLHRSANGMCTIVGRNAGSHAFRGFNTHSEISLIRRTVVGHHQGQVQLFATLFGQ